jgi:hypothetical protein
MAMAFTQKHGSLAPVLQSGRIEKGRGKSQATMQKATSDKSQVLHSDVT